MVLKFVYIFLMVLFCVSYSFEPKRPEKALQEIYPGGKLEIKTIPVTRDDTKNLEKQYGLKLDPGLADFYIVKKDGKIIAYGYVDIHIVRTKPEMVLYTITPDGKIDVVQVLAFQEPLDYLPDESWFNQFHGRDENSVKFKKDISNVSGATLTARAAAENARKALILWRYFFGNKSATPGKL